MLMFLISMIVALMLLSAACVVWIGSMAQNLLVGLVVVGLMWIVISVALYFGAIHRTLVQWRRRMDTIYDVSLTVELMYRQVATFVKKILFREIPFSNNSLILIHTKFTSFSSCSTATGNNLVKVGICVMVFLNTVYAT